MVRDAKLEGSFSVMSIADLIQWARSAQKSGEIEVKSTQNRIIRIVILDGRIIHSSNNSVREKYGNYLVQLGLCRQEDIDWARDKEVETGSRLGFLLVNSGRLPETVAIATLTQKTIEDLCDLFLWKDGHFKFRNSSFQFKQFLAIDLDPIRIVNEGLRRQVIWSKLSVALHPSVIFESSRRSFPTDVEWDDVVVARKVLEQSDGARNVEEIIESLPFSRYKTLLAIAELRKHQVLQRGDHTELGNREFRIHAMVAEAKHAAEEDRWGEAVRMLEGLAAAYPQRQELTQLLLETLEGFRESVYRHNFMTHDIPVVTIGIDGMRHLDLDQNSGYIVSRIDGRTSVGEILRIVPISEVNGLRIIKRLLDAKVIDFPYRKR